MNKTKRVLSVVLAVLMLSSLIAALAIADEMYTVVINYVFKGGKQAAPSWTATLAEGSNLKQTVTSPTVVGYKPDQATFNVSVNNITENKTYTVTYYPANVGFTVNHYLQNVADNNYTLNVSERHDGFTESEVGDGLAKTTYTGFAALLYNTKAKVAADGSTVVEIYYDRNYYMMSFNLDGGYGVEPIYARYGAALEVGTPTKPGHTFSGWEPTVPTTVPAENTTYKAKWTPGESGFTVVFWYENANDDGYSYAGSIKPANDAPGTQKSSNDYQNENFTGRDAAHFTYNSAKAETVTVKGDGSTVLNVYFTRNTYTLTFKNAVLSCGKVEHSHSHDQCCTKTHLVHILCNTDKCPYGYEHSHSSSCYKDLTITAKYGADIHNNFPIKDGDKTIWWKVPDNTETYGELDEQTYLGSIDTMPGEDITFTKFGSESGAKIYYYVETLNGETGDTTYPKTGANAKNYKLYKTIDLEYSSDTNLTYREEFHPIIGFTQGDSNPYLPKDGSVGMENENYLYYTRNSYKLKFFNHNGFVADKEQNVQYEAPLKGKAFTPAYPAGLEANAYEFAGWYTTEGCYDGSEVDWDTAKMPAGNVVVYAKWAPKTHTVKAYLTKEVVGGEAIYTYHVPHGTAVPSAPAKPTNGNYTFVGWFYEENGVEKAFDFSMPIVKDLNLYAKWSSNTLVTYTIYYKSGDTEIAEPTTGSALAGTTLTFEAKTGDELNKDYQSGYFPNTGSHSLTMDINGNNEFTFVYVVKEKVNYTVRYLDKATGEPVVVNGVPTPDKTGETSDAIITEKFVQISGYAPDAYQKRLVLSATEAENVITFWYTKDDVHAPVQIVHWTQNIAGEGYTEYQSSTNINGVIGQEYSATPLTIEGFTFKEGKVGDTATALVDGKLKGNVTENGLVLNMYYDRVKYSYTVRYVDATDNNKDIDSTANVTGEGLFGAQVIGSQKEFNGYMPADNEPKQKSIIIGTGTNEIIFYYHPCYYIGHVQSGSLNNTDTIRLTGSKANLTAAVTPGYLYGGAFSDKACENVQKFESGENAINFTPVKGKTYYIWEVSETYLKPRTYAVSKHLQEKNGQLCVVELYLMTHADRQEYQYMGFEIVGENAAISDRTVYEVVNATKGGNLYQQMYVGLDGNMAASKTEVVEADRRAGYIAMYKLSADQFAKIKTGGLTFQPYWVTLDGIIVRGVNSRNCTYKGDGETQINADNQARIGSNVGIYTNASQQTIDVAYSYVFEAADVEVVTPEVPETPEIPEVPEAPEMTLNSDAMYLRAQYTYEMMTNTVKFISAIDVNECTEYGFVINGEVVKCEDVAETVDGYNASYLFGGSVNGAMLMSCNMLLDGLVDGMTLNVTPYYVALDGTTVVYGETRTLVYRQWVGLEG